MSKVEQALKSAIQFIESTVVLTDSQNRVTQDTLAQCKAALTELEKCKPVGEVVMVHEPEWMKPSSSN